MWTIGSEKADAIAAIRRVPIQDLGVETLQTAVGGMDHLIAILRSDSGAMAGAEWDT